MIDVVLLEIENPGNLGAIARSMKNFDFKNLVLINPKCEVTQETKNRAKRAQEILDNIKIKTIKELKEYDYIIGTTSAIGKDYNIPRVPITPEQLSEKIDENKNIALLIGRESHGLNNEEIEMCDFVVSIPTSKNYDSMNISHAVTIILYELHKKLGKNKINEHINAISKEEKEQIMRMLNEILDKMIFRTEQERETQIKVWKKIVAKSFMSKREAFALMGFLRKILEN